ncbi:MAG: 3-isopropylmalate dehydratase small subunit [Polyangiaceae bacterium]|jgi:3-isopropylmalate/(R)-2-methylmalate dehydratase small subunit|nr:3-isopropylmalate dehydratase small subunit [Polyangiaceae bacterium]
MSEEAMVGTAHVYGDNIDTDRIIPGKYTKTLSEQDLAEHAMEDLDPEFRARVRPGDFVVGGENFGCGSSREQAPRALKACGVSAVVARSFARIFYRNAINIGLPVIELPGHCIEAGCQLRVDARSGTVQVVGTPTRYTATPLPDVMMAILAAGGLVAYLKKTGDYDV